MKNKNIRYQGSEVLLRLARAAYKDFLSNQLVSGFSKPLRCKNRYRKSWSEDEYVRFHHQKFSAMKQWLNKN
ncbi:MAG: hypothetical protein ACI8PD_002008 [Nitrospinales bacterium]|jgi:hypothetical protein